MSDQNQEFSRVFASLIGKDTPTERDSANENHYIMALDAGTTSERAILIDVYGSIIGEVGAPITQIYPHPGWVEHDPTELLAKQMSVISEVQYKTGIHSDRIAAVGITNQRETTIVWDRENGQPIYNAIVWQCRRTAEDIAAIEDDGMDKIIRDRTGLVPDAYFSATKIAWILKHVEGARAMAENGQLAFGTVDSWMIYNLTGGKVHATDYTNASRTMLFDIHKLCWDSEICDYFDIPMSMLPEVKWSSDDYGVVAADIMSRQPHITGVAGDQQASLFGHCCFDAGQVKNTYGTGCFMLMNTGDKAVVSKAGLLTTIGIAEGGKICYALEGSVFQAGSVVQWLRDELHMVESAADTERIAQQVPDTGGVYLVPAFTGLGAPYWDSKARGMLSGMTRGTNRAHIVRAALESMALQTYDVLTAMELDSGVPLKELAVDGGACRNNFTMQFQSDILNINIDRPANFEATALGAAYLAGLKVGYWVEKSELIANNIIEKTYVPEMEESTRRQILAGWKSAVEQARH